MAKAMSASMKPVFVFVPGALHTRYYLEGTISALDSLGYTSRVTQHGTQVDPSAPLDTPVAQNWDPDVDAIRRVLSEVIDDQGRNVVLVAHSYGGAPASEGCKGFAKQHRETRGLPGGVVKLVWFSALVLDVGSYCWEPSGGQSPFGPNIILDGDLCYKSELSRDWFYSECTEEQKDGLVAALRPQTWKAFVDVSKATYAAWKDIDGFYVTLGADKAIPPVVQKMIVEHAKGHRFELLEIEDSDHTPFVSKPQEVIRILRRAAGEDGA